MELFTISVWLRSVSITVSRVMPAGRGVRVVNTVRFDILNAGECLLCFSFGDEGLYQGQASKWV